MIKDFLIMKREHPYGKETFQILKLFQKIAKKSQNVRK